MRKFISVLLLVGAVSFVGCKEETAGDKVDKKIDEVNKKVDDLKK